MRKRLQTRQRRASSPCADLHGARGQKGDADGGRIGKSKEAEWTYKNALEAVVEVVVVSKCARVRAGCEEGRWWSFADDKSEVGWLITDGEMRCDDVRESLPDPCPTKATRAPPSHAIAIARQPLGAYEAVAMRRRRQCTRH